MPLFYMSLFIRLRTTDFQLHSCRACNFSGAGGGLSEPARHAGCCLHARRAERRACAHRRQEDGGTARPAVRDRKPPRRRRQYRGRRRRACGARRLHAADGQQQHPRHQRGLYKHLTYSPGKDFVPITLDRHAGQYPGRQSGCAGAFAEGADRARQSAARQDQFCLVRLRRGRASRRRTVQDRRPRSTSCMCPTRARRRRCRM